MIVDAAIRAHAAGIDENDIFYDKFTSTAWGRG